MGKGLLKGSQKIKSREKEWFRKRKEKLRWISVPRTTQSRKF